MTTKSPYKFRVAYRSSGRVTEFSYASTLAGAMRAAKRRAGEQQLTCGPMVCTVQVRDARGEYSATRSWLDVAKLDGKTVECCDDILEMVSIIAKRAQAAYDAEMKRAEELWQITTSSQLHHAKGNSRCTTKFMTPVPAKNLTRAANETLDLARGGSTLLRQLHISVWPTLPGARRTFQQSQCRDWHGITRTVL